MSISFVSLRFTYSTIAELEKRSSQELPSNTTSQNQTRAETDARVQQVSSFSGTRTKLTTLQNSQLLLPPCPPLSPEIK